MSAPRAPAFEFMAKEIRQICLIDMAYAKPDDITLLVLQTFADWQAEAESARPLFSSITFIVQVSKAK